MDAIPQESGSHNSLVFGKVTQMFGPEIFFAVITMDIEYVNGSRLTGSQASSGSVFCAGVVTNKRFSPLPLRIAEADHKFYSLVQPPKTCVINPVCMSIHGLPEAPLLDARPFAEVWNYFSGWMRSFTAYFEALDAVALVAHNGSCLCLVVTVNLTLRPPI
jgi:hypothetical protein